MLQPLHLGDRLGLDRDRPAFVDARLGLRDALGLPLFAERGLKLSEGTLLLGRAEPADAPVGAPEP